MVGGTTRRTAVAASLVLSILAACSLTVSPGDYAQGAGGDGGQGPLPEASTRPPVPEGGARLVVISGEREPFRPEDSGFRIREMAEAIVSPDGTIGEFYFERSPPASATFSQVLLQDGKIVLTSLGSGTIAVAPFDRPSGAVTGEWGIFSVSGAAQKDLATYLVRPNLLVGVGGYVEVDGGPEYNDKIVTAAVDLNARTAGELTARPETALVERRGHARLFVYKDFLYALGGLREGPVLVDFVEVSRLGADGMPGPFAVTTPLPVNLLIPEVVAGAGMLYSAAGIVDGVLVTDKVYFSRINEADGTVGAWTAGPSLPVALHYSCMIFHENRLYVLGGLRPFVLSDGGTRNEKVDTIYALDVNPDGTPVGTWREVGKLPGPRGMLAAVMY